MKISANLSQSVAAGIFFLVYTTVAFLTIYPHSPAASIFPVVTGCLGILLSLLLAVTTRHTGTKPTDVNTIESTQSCIAHAELYGLVWIAGFVVATLILGFYPGLIVATMVYARFGRNVRWKTGILLATATSVSAFVILDVLLRHPMPEGAVFYWL